MSEIEIVPWKPELNALLLPLFEEVFRKKVDRRFLETKFTASPARRPPVAHLALDQGRAVGFYCLLPTRFTMGGREYWGGHSVDTMVLKDYRKDGLFGRLMRASIEAAGGENLEGGRMDFLYGCGVDAAIPSFLKKGWELMYRMQLMSSPAAGWPRYRMLSRAGMAPGLGLDRLPPANSRAGGLSPVQDEALYKWKAALTPSGWREFQSGWAWLRPERDLWVGDMRPHADLAENGFAALWSELRKFARRKGFPNVIFQASPAIMERTKLPEGTPLLGSWQTLAYRFPHSPDVTRLELVFGDVDAF